MGEEAKQECEKGGCIGFTYQPSVGRMWRLQSISDPNQFVTQSIFDVWTLTVFEKVGQGASGACRVRRNGQLSAFGNYVVNGKLGCNACREACVELEGCVAIECGGNCELWKERPK